MRLDQGSEKQFGDSFWQGQDIILNAVDNVEARRFIDTSCCLHDKTFIDSGTQGFIANLDVYKPGVTDHYKGSGGRSRQIPVCTLSNSPSHIEHTIQYGKFIFEELFTILAQDISQLAEDPGNYVLTLKKINEGE